MEGCMDIFDTVRIGDKFVPASRAELALVMLTTGIAVGFVLADLVNGVLMLM